MTKVKFATNIDLGKKQSVDNGIMQKFVSIEALNSNLTVDGMFGYLVGDGVYLNINGNNTKIADITDTNPNTVDNVSKIFFSDAEPLVGFEVSNLWYKPSTQTMYIRTATDWTVISTSLPNKSVLPYDANKSYEKDDLIIYKDYIYRYNNTVSSVGGGTLPDFVPSGVSATQTNSWVNVSKDKELYFNDIKPFDTAIGVYPRYSMFLYKGSLYYTKQDTNIVVGTIAGTTQPKPYDEVFSDNVSNFVNVSQKSNTHTISQTMVNGGSVGNLSLSSDGKIVTITHDFYQKYPTIIIVDETTKEEVGVTKIYDNSTTVKLRFSKPIQEFQTNFIVVVKE